MTDALLFFHLLGAAFVFTGMIVDSALVFGARIELGIVKLSNIIWGIGLIGVLLLGIALAIDIDGYELWDAWVLIAIVLWLGAGGTGDRVRPAAEAAASSGTAIAREAVPAHWIRVVLVVLLLADMIWKPWV